MREANELNVLASQALDCHARCARPAAGLHHKKASLHFGRLPPAAIPAAATAAVAAQTNAETGIPVVGPMAQQRATTAWRCTWLHEQHDRWLDQHPLDCNFTAGMIITARGTNAQIFRSGNMPCCTHAPCHIVHRFARGRTSCVLQGQHNEARSGGDGMA